MYRVRFELNFHSADTTEWQDFIKAGAGRIRTRCVGWSVDSPQDKFEIWEARSSRPFVIIINTRDHEGFVRTEKVLVATSERWQDTPVEHWRKL
ncbi:MAG: hypothetical protein AAB350_01770 [Patescibacteria group bacterium]